MPKQMGLWDLGEGFGHLRWDSRGNRYLDRLSKTSACCSSPSLPISVFLPWLWLPSSGSCISVDLFGGAIRQELSRCQPSCHA